MLRKERYLRMDNLKNLVENQKDLDPETVAIINENFWDLIGEKKCLENLKFLETELVNGDLI